jgi:hypothetical protein
LNTSRRTFIAAGTAGVAMLALAGWLRGPHAPPTAATRRALDADAEAIFAAVAPVLLAGAWPQEPAAHAIALHDTLAGIDTAIAGLPPSSRTELGELVALLSLPPVRLAFAGIHGSWSTASPVAVRQFLERCRSSPFLLLRAAYGALHSLTFAAWYGNPKSWPAIGYPGPPVLETAA